MGPRGASGAHLGFNSAGCVDHAAQPASHLHTQPGLSPQEEGPAGVFVEVLPSASDGCLF